MDKYNIHERIARGSFGIVFRVEDKEQNQFSAKRINIKKVLKPKNKKYLIQEIWLSKIHKCPYIINLHDHIIHKNMIILIHDLCVNGDLYYFIRDQKIRRQITSDLLICKWIQQIAIGVKYLHVNNIIHRDLNTKNIFLDNNFDIKIGDLGSISFFDNYELKHTIFPKKINKSPEMIKKTGYGCKNDIWCLGLILYELLTGDKPFEHKNISKYNYNVLNQIVHIDNKRKNYKFYNRILQRLLCKDYNQRCSLNYIINNRFLNKIYPLEKHKITMDLPLFPYKMIHYEWKIIINQFKLNLDLI